MQLLIILIITLLVYVIVAYNTMIKMRNQIKEAWSDIDVQLKRRYNLIPNIVETVKGYAAHEEGVFTKVTEARANAINATGIQGQGDAENMLSGALKSLFAVAENYPELKANENFMQLQNELVDTEDKIQAARRFYNTTVRDFNAKIQQFPAKLIADAFKFKPEAFFEIGEADAEQRENVQVTFKEETPVVTPTVTPPMPVETPPVITPVEEVKLKEAPVPEERVEIEPKEFAPETPEQTEVAHEPVNKEVTEPAPVVEAESEVITPEPETPVEIEEDKKTEATVTPEIPEEAPEIPATPVAEETVKTPDVTPATDEEEKKEANE